MLASGSRKLHDLAATAIVLAASVIAPAAALACPTCYASAAPRVIASYVLTAAIMTLLPFTIIGIGAGIALYLRRQTRALSRAQSLLPSADPIA